MGVNQLLEKLSQYRLIFFCFLCVSIANVAVVALYAQYVAKELSVVSLTDKVMSREAAT